MKIQRIAVITPTYQTPTPWLEQCVRSVQAQSVGPVMHVLINDGDPDFCLPNCFAGQFIQTDRHYGDFGDTPRWIGVQWAIKWGADAIAFLDADNWFERHHLRTCIEACRDQRAEVATSQRMLVALNGAPIAKCHMCGTLDFADTSSMLFRSSAFEALRAWGNMEDWQHAIDDRLVWQRVRDLGFRIGQTNTVTFNYRCTHRMFYETYGWPVPDGVKTEMYVEEALARWQCQLST